MTIGAFGVVLAVSSQYRDKAHPDDITRLNGLGYTNPVLGLLMALFMLSLAGIPPGMGGFLGKFYVFSAIIGANYIGLAVIGALCAAVACYYYLRVIVAMYFIEPTSDTRVVALDSSLLWVLLLCGAAILLLGLFPSSLYSTLGSLTVQGGLQH